MSDWPELTAACQRGIMAAREKQGRYGGRYIARTGEDKFIVLDDDDPEKYRDSEDIDIIAQATPELVYGIGRSASYIQPDGTVEFPKR